jgi:predicted nuclease of predicted toxin-antitoxin system
VQVHDDHFAQGTYDEIWLSEVGKRGWIILTKDDRIRYHIAALTAIKSARATAIILPKGNLTASEMAAIFLKVIPQIKRFIEKQKPPFIARLTPGGTLSLIEIQRKY